MLSVKEMKYTISHYCYCPI